MHEIEVCLTPALFGYYKKKNSLIVIVDILRATSSICTAFQHGVAEIIPVATIEEARELKSKGFLVAAERDGVVLDFADFGNSPNNFMGENVKGKTIVYSTTNGTQALKEASTCGTVVIGSYLNLNALATWIGAQSKEVVIFCSGWKNRFNLEDTVFAGALAEKLIASGSYTTNCDSAMAAMDLWSVAKHDLVKYIDKCSHRHRLAKLVLDDIIEYCHTTDTTTVVPVFRDGKITAG